MRVLVTRPEPAAARTAARLAALGHDAIVAPLLLPRALDWQIPPGDWQAVAFTSAMGPALAGPALARLTRLPAYVVGSATAAATRDAGFTGICEARGDATALFARAAADGVVRLLHLAGRDRSDALMPPGLKVTVCPVYAADLAPALPASASTADLVLLYSMRTARHFITLAAAARIEPARLAAAVLSPAVATALGTWPQVRVAAEPTEDALFAACGLTCEKPG